MKWPWKKGKDEVLSKLAEMEKRIGGIEVIQTELLRRVITPPQPRAPEYRYATRDETPKIG